MKNILLLILSFFTTIIIHAHNGVDHSKPENKIQADSNVSQNLSKHINIEPTNTHADNDMSTFSSYHPLIVHFPIVLLIILPFFQIVSLFKFKKEIGWLVIFLTSVGFLTAYLASNNFHPHTTGLPNNVIEILQEHDYYAYLTVWISLAALLIKLVSQFLLKSNRWSEYIVLLLLTIGSYSVIMAGHHGAQLTHIYGVGAEGKYIEMNMHHKEGHSH